MKQYLILVAVLLALTAILIACGNNNDDTSNNETDQQEEDDSGGNEWDDDEEELGIGETGVSHSPAGKAEITLDAAESLDVDDFDDKTDVTEPMAVYMTVKNVGDDPIKPTDVLYDGELFETGEKFGSVWTEYDGVSEEWKDQIEPNEETSGMIVFDGWDSESYELVFGDMESTPGNKVSFGFDKDEMG